MAMDLEARALAWRHAQLEAVCDVIEPWAHGTVLRATGYPTYYEYNVVRVEDDPSMSVAALSAFADEALAGLEHRRLEFDLAAAADLVRAGFREEGWQTQRLLWMRHDGRPPSAADVVVEVERVDYDAARDLRVIWHDEDSPDLDPAGYLPQARELARRLGVEVFAVREEGVPVAFVELARDRRAAELTVAYVRPDRRGRGLGTALIDAAVDAAADAEDLWICADDEDRAKSLYARRGFRPVRTSMDFLAPLGHSDRQPRP